MENHHVYDIAIIGGGPGGYPAAIKAAQSGKKVALIEAKDLGGTCLNRGCIPSKTLIASAEMLKRVNEAKEFGIIAGGPITFDYAQMVNRKDQVVGKTRKSLEGLITANQITIIRGFGKFTSPNTLKVTGKDNVIIQAKSIIIATGSEPRNIPAFPFDQKQILDSTALLERTSLPKSLVIIGGGIIGCEFASLYNALEVPVTIVEMMPSIIPMESPAVSSFLAKSFKKRGVEIYTNAKVDGIEKNASGIKVKLADGKSIEGEIALVAVGRSLNTSNIGLDAAGVTVSDNGIIPVDDHMQTNVPGIYAIGDIASKWWLAHVATHQGIIAAANACGGNEVMHYDAVPSVIFTDPEIATVGLSLEAAIEKKFDAVIGAFPFQALGKSQATMQTEGFAQVVIDKGTGQILGAQVIGHEASALIAEMALAIANELTVESIAETIHAHPTIPEAWLEATLYAMDAPLHLPPKKR